MLLALLGVVVWRYRSMWEDAREREQRVLRASVPDVKAQPMPPVQAPSPLVATNYIDVAQKMLFAKDRNPNIILPPPTPPQAPPPMPALPVFYGLMTGFGDPGIILSDRPGSQRTYRAGEMVGEFKLVSFDNSRITLDWGGKKVERRLDELVAKQPQSLAASASAASAAPAASGPVITNATASPLGPGQDTGGGFRACQPNDSTPNGTVQGGLRKVEVATPFGKSCKWEPVR